MSQPTILVISNDAAFPQAVMSRWQQELTVPAFTLVSADACTNGDLPRFDAALVGGVDEAVVAKILKALKPAEKPVLFLRRTGQKLPALNGNRGFLSLFQEGDLWRDAAVLVLTELLHASQLSVRLQQIEQLNSHLTKDATLGRYMLDNRHSLNNALTSVLGNSELLLLEPETLAPLAAGVRSQIDTIRNMSLRMHEILQRFSSLEKEMNVAEKQTAEERKAKAQTAGARI